MILSKNMLRRKPMNGLQTHSKIAKSESANAYVCCASGFKYKLNYVRKTISDIHYALQQVHYLR